MCKECAKEVSHLMLGKTGFKLSKEERAKLPGKEATSYPISALPEEDQIQHRIYRRAYEALYREYNKESLKKYQGAYHIVLRKNHPDELKIKAREQYLKNPERYHNAERTRRAQQNKVRTEGYSSQDIVDIYGTICYLCKEEIDMEAPRSLKNYHPRALHLDHVVPIGIGGTDTVDNIRPTHARCNLTRSKSSPMEGIDIEITPEMQARIDNYKPTFTGWGSKKLGRPFKDK